MLDTNARERAEASARAAMSRDWQLFGPHAFSAISEMNEHVENLAKACTDEQRADLSRAYMNRIWQRYVPYSFNFVSEVLEYAASLASDSLRYEYVREYLTRLNEFSRRGGRYRQCQVVETLRLSDGTIKSRELLTLSPDDVHELENARDELRAKLLAPHRIQPKASGKRLFEEFPEGIVAPNETNHDTTWIRDSAERVYDLMDGRSDHAFVKLLPADTKYDAARKCLQDLSRRDGKLVWTETIACLVEFVKLVLPSEPFPHKVTAEHFTHIDGKSTSAVSLRKTRASDHAIGRAGEITGLNVEVRRKRRQTAA